MEAGYGTILGLDSGRCPFLSFTASPRAPLGGGVLGRVLGQPNRCIQNRKSFPDSDIDSNIPFLRPPTATRTPGRTIRTRTEQIDPFPADRMASPNAFYRLAFSRMKMESPSGRPQIESTRLLETRLVAMGRTLHSA